MVTERILNQTNKRILLSIATTTLFRLKQTWYIYKQSSEDQIYDQFASETNMLIMVGESRYFAFYLMNVLKTIDLSENVSQKTWQENASYCYGLTGWFYCMSTLV